MARRRNTNFRELARLQERSRQQQEQRDILRAARRVSESFEQTARSYLENNPDMAYEHQLELQDFLSVGSQIRNNSSQQNINPINNISLDEPTVYLTPQVLQNRMFGPNTDLSDIEHYLQNHSRNRLYRLLVETSFTIENIFVCEYFICFQELGIGFIILDLSDILATEDRLSVLESIESFLEGTPFQLVVNGYDFYKFNSEDVAAINRFPILGNEIFENKVALEVRPNLGITLQDYQELALKLKGYKYDKEEFPILSYESGVNGTTIYYAASSGTWIYDLSQL